MIALYAILIIALIFLSSFFVNSFVLPLARKRGKPEPPPTIQAAPTFKTLIGSQYPFWQVAAQFNQERVSPYEYWRMQWEKTGDIKALEQMERFVETDQ